MKRYVIIVAGGKGLRMGANIPKQFMKLKGLPILMHSLRAFHSFDAKTYIILVLPQEHIAYWESLCDTYACTIPHSIVAGGDERFHSVKKGLAAINDNNSLVAIHDGVRPLVNNETIDRCFSTAQKLGNAIPVIPVVDSVRIVEGEQSKIVSRDALFLVQTPQTFKTALIKQAFQQKYSPNFTDDATVLEAMGETINLVAGNLENRKITTAIDLKIAEIFLK